MQEPKVASTQMTRCPHLNLTPDPDCLGLSRCLDCGDFVLSQWVEPEPDWGWAVTPQGEEYSVA